MSLGVDKSMNPTTSAIDAQQAPFLGDLYQQGADQLAGFQPNQDIAQGSMNAWQQQLNPQSNPFMQDMTQQFRDQLGQANQQVGGQAAQAGGFGGGRHGVANHLNQQAYQSNLGSFMGNQTQLGLQQQGQAIDQTGTVLGGQEYQQQQGALQNQSGLLGNPTVLTGGGGGGGGFNVGWK